MLGKGKATGVKRKATVLISKRIVKEAKLRNMPLSEYIRKQGLDIVQTQIKPETQVAGRA